MTPIKMLRTKRGKLPKREKKALQGFPTMPCKAILGVASLNWSWIIIQETMDLAERLDHIRSSAFFRQLKTIDKALAFWRGFFDSIGQLKPMMPQQAEFETVCPLRACRSGSGNVLVIGHGSVSIHAPARGATHPPVIA